jgi:hypothetical protein
MNYIWGGNPVIVRLLRKLAMTDWNGKRDYGLIKYLSLSLLKKRYNSKNK